MDVVLASDVTLLIYKDGTYRPFVCATDLSIDFTMETKEVRTIGDGKWKKPRGQSITYTLSLSGLVSINSVGDPNTFDILEYLRQMIPVQFRVLWDETSSGLQKYAEGLALPVNIRLPSGAEGFANSNIEMRGDGECVIKDSLVTCTATIGSATVGQRDEFPAGTIRISFSGASANTERIEYAIDGGGREAIIVSGAPNGFIYPTGLYNGTHDLVLYPICENGDDGVPYPLTFTI